MPLLLSYTAVIWVLRQRSSPLTYHTQAEFLSQYGYDPLKNKASGGDPNNDRIGNYQFVS